MIVFGNGFKKAVAQAVESAMESERKTSQKKFTNWSGLHSEITKLKEEAETYKVEKDRRQEEADRREREIQHKLGLHKVQVEHERTQATEAAKLEIERTGLDRDQKRFEEQMQFHQERFEKEVTYQRGLLEKMLERLPTAEVYADLTPHGNGNGAERETVRR